MESQFNTNGRRGGGSSWLLGGLLIVLGGLFLVNEILNINILGSLIPITILGGIGFTFFAIYLNNRQHWWALIPAYVMWAIAGIVVLSNLFGVHGNAMGAYVMFAIAFPFLYVYARNRENWWALIPAGIMGTIGIGLLLGTVMEFLFPAIPALMVIAGLYLLFRNMAGRRSESVEAQPVKPEQIEFEPITQKTGPEADRPRS